MEWIQKDAASEVFTDRTYISFEARPAPLLAYDHVAPAVPSVEGRLWPRDHPDLGLGHLGAVQHGGQVGHVLLPRVEALERRLVGLGGGRWRGLLKLPSLSRFNFGLLLSA